MFIFFTYARRIVVQQLLSGLFGGLWRVVVRLQKHERQQGWTCPQPSPSLHTRSWCWKEVRTRVWHIHTCHSHCISEARVRAKGDKRARWMETPHRSSVLSCERCYCHQVFFSSNPHFCTSHATVLHSGPPTTVLPQRHAEEDFLALVRHNAATKLEMERWPPVLKKRGVRKPTVDEHYTQALCNWVATLEAPPADLPQAKRPGWWRHDVSLFGERSAPPDGAEAVAAVEPVRSKRAYHQPSRELRLWVVDCAFLRHMQGWDNKMIADHLAAMGAACLPTLPLDADTATVAGREQEGRPRTARCFRCDHSHSASEVRQCWRGRRPDFRVCDAAHLQQSGRATWPAVSSAARASSTPSRLAGPRRRRTQTLDRTQERKREGKGKKVNSKTPRNLGPADRTVQTREEGRTVQPCGESEVAGKSQYSLGQKYRGRISQIKKNSVLMVEEEDRQPCLED